MAIEITLTQTSFFKKRLHAQDIIQDDLSYGVVDNTWRLIDPRDLQSVYYCFYNPNHIGCGVRVYYHPRHKETFSLTLPTPGTEYDIEVGYQVLERVMEKWNLHTFLQDGQEYEKEDINHLTEKMKQFNIAKFSNLDTSEETILIPCVKWPILFSSKEVEEWIEKEDMESFTKRLHELQEKDYYYAIPRLFQKSEGNLLAVYAISPDTDTILPMEPSLGLYLDKTYRQQSHLNIDFQIGLISYEDHGVIGQIPYNTFLEEVSFDACEKYDEAHRIVKALSEKRIHEIAYRYRSENEEN
ncbi:MAG: DUF4299 family protein [Solobacterium sp.]|nr:DUF4299 family protein [Solobacterium sp.]